MLLSPCVALLFLIAALLAGSACTRPGVEASKRAALQTFLSERKGKPFEEFLKVTNWKASYEERVSNNSNPRIVVFNAFGLKAVEGAGNSLTYHRVTEWNDKQPGITTTGGANQPLGVLPGNATYSTESIKIPEIRSGCKLTVWVDANGLVSSWRTEGSECFLENLDRLKRQ